jgi:uncharacterized protein (DUF362 family)
MNAACQIVHAREDAAALLPLVRAWLPEGDFRRIFIKPNWVMHEEHPEFPIRALVTSPALIEATVEACLEKYPRAEWITVGDVPLQSCAWERLLSQCGLSDLRARYERRAAPRIRFLDLRRDRFQRVDGFLVPDPDSRDGDPEGYREVALDHASFLEPISTASTRFRVSDYDPGVTTSSHRLGHHRYLVCGTVLASDLFVNLPKMKTHQKAGVTGALKNLVGINGRMSHLVHHRQGGPRKQGDEFSPATPWPVRLQVRVRERLQKRSRGLFQAARPAWLLLKKLYGIRTEVTREHLAAPRLYIAAGSWHGNDTIWRMVYDLNRIVRFAPAGGGALAAQPQRAYVAIMDALVSGEGNGPLQSLPVESGLLLAARDPFLLDTVMARLMDFDPRRIPCLAQRRAFGDPEWGAFDADTATLALDEATLTGLRHLPPIKRYLPPPGWRGHIENS